jgi:hypothetical protein
MMKKNTRTEQTPISRLPAFKSLPLEDRYEAGRSLRETDRDPLTQI